MLLNILHKKFLFFFDNLAVVWTFVDKDGVFEVFSIL